MAVQGGGMQFELRQPHGMNTNELEALRLRRVLHFSRNMHVLEAQHVPVEYAPFRGQFNFMNINGQDGDEHSYTGHPFSAQQVEQAATEQAEQVACPEQVE